MFTNKEYIKASTKQREVIMNLEKSFNVALAMRGMKQADLAREMKVTTPYINQVIKNGKLSIRRLAEICERLDFKVWEFVKLGED
jgi:DNA-binding Xre family transcriptional regulator